MVAFLINVSVISVSGAVCNSSTLSSDDLQSCKNLDLNEASFLLKVHQDFNTEWNTNTRIIFIQCTCTFLIHADFLARFYIVCCSQNVLGSWSSKLFAIALLASGQSSTITGTYAGQYVMQVSFYCHFLKLQLKLLFFLWKIKLVLYQLWNQSNITVQSKKENQKTINGQHALIRLNHLIKWNST